jgi:hypothetical protein
MFSFVSDVRRRLVDMAVEWPFDDGDPVFRVPLNPGGETGLPELTYQWSPEPAKPLLAEGATMGHFVIWTGKPGPAHIATAVAIVDDEGHIIVDTGEFTDCTVVD